jgi:peptidoglycan/LPS O-acetylase OafA/YrhL
MARKRRLLFKDLDFIRFLAFVPIFLYCTLFTLQPNNGGLIDESSNLLAYFKHNSFDFFFFLSAFLLTSHGLREYKYTDKFSLKNFYIRRLMRIFPLLILALIFAFIVHPWIINTLKLTSVVAPFSYSYLLPFPNYFAQITADQYIYLAVIWTIYMFLQFYLVWGIILRIFILQIKYVAYLIIGIGVASRIYHALVGTSYEFDTLSMGVPIGMGVIIAVAIRNNHRLVDVVKHLPKSAHILMYGIGIVTLGGYLIVGSGYLNAIVPLLTCSFFGYIIIDQTFGKNSIYKLRKNKAISHLGKISYGLLIYQSIIVVIGVIAIESLEFSVSSPAILIGFIVIAFIISWILADISFNIYERPILRIKSEFKKS